MGRKLLRDARQQWRERLSRHASSKLSVAEFFGREQVSVPSFYYWRKKLARVERNTPSISMARFLPVGVTASTAASVCLQASFPNGATLTLDVTDQGLLQVAIETIAVVGTTGGDS